MVIRPTTHRGAVATVVVSIISTQIGATVAVRIFASALPSGAAFLRLAFAAAIMIILVRPRFDGVTLRALTLSALFGLTLAAMNFSFYEGISRIPLGIGVALEFIGPLGIAIVGSRSRRDLLWVCLAAAGIALVAPWGVGTHVDPIGMLLVLFAGVLWACYIILSGRVGAEFPDATGLVIALVVGAVVLLPIAIVNPGSRLLNLDVLGAGMVVAVLSSLVTYSFELAALRTLRTTTFGVLMSLEPAVAALVAFALLGQQISVRPAIAIVCIVVASAGASWFSRDSLAVPVG